MHAPALQLVRRGLQAHKDIEFELPTWGVIMLACTALLFAFMNFHIEYTFGRLVPTLVMVESTETLAIEPADSKPLLGEKMPLDMDTKTNAPATELLLVKKKPITHSLCSTMRHLRKEAGCLARYRGFAGYCVYALAFSTVTCALTSVRQLPHGLAPIVAALVCANLATAWTHAAIAAPSDRTWFERVLGFKAWKQVAGPTFFFAAAKHMSCMAPMYLAEYLGLHGISWERVHTSSAEEQRDIFYKISTVGLAAMAMTFFILFPAKVILTRVQASQLPEAEETIVPFDKGFGGRIVPEELGGDGKLRARDAWRTFHEDSRLTLLTAYAKFVMMEISLLVAFAVTICGELVLILGDDVKRFIPGDERTMVGQ